MDAVKESCIRAHLRREGVKETGCFEQHIDALIDVAHKYHRGTGRFFFFAAGEGAGSHIVLHDLDAVFVLELDSGDLIEGHAVPEPDQTHSLSPHIVKEVGYRGLPARNQDAVGRNLLVKMRFTRASRAQLAEVEVVLHKRDHADEEQPFLTVGEHIRLHADGPQQHIHPFVLGKSFAALLQLVDVHMGHLDGGEFANADGRPIFVFFDVFIIQLDDAPDAAAE